MIWHTSFTATQTIPTTQLLGDLHQRNNAIRRSDIIPINVIRVRRRPVCRPNRLVRIPPLDVVFDALSIAVSRPERPSIGALPIRVATSTNLGGLSSSNAARPGRRLSLLALHRSNHHRRAPDLVECIKPTTVTSSFV